LQIGVFNIYAIIVQNRLFGTK